MAAVTVRVVHVNRREHGGCANNVVDGPLPVRELPPPRGDEQVQHRSPRRRGTPRSPVPARGWWLWGASRCKQHGGEQGTPPPGLRRRCSAKYLLPNCGQHVRTAYIAGCAGCAGACVQRRCASPRDAADCMSVSPAASHTCPSCGNCINRGQVRRQRLGALARYVTP